jgi:hypothetical protein
VHVYMPLHMDLSREVEDYCHRLGLCLLPEIASMVMSINHVGVTTIERLDQGHLYPLGERVTVGAALPKELPI